MAAATAAALGVLTPMPCIPVTAAPWMPGVPQVLIGNMPAARVNDMTSHVSCVAPIPSPVGKVMPPGCPTVQIGG